MISPGPLADLMLVVCLVVLLLVCGAFIGVRQHVEHVLRRGEGLDKDGHHALVTRHLGGDAEDDVQKIKYCLELCGPPWFSSQHQAQS